MSEKIIDRPELESLGVYEFGWSDSDKAGASAKRGISEEVVRDISNKKSEPEWMLERRLKGFDFFLKKPMPSWGADLSGIDFDNIKYFVRSTERQATSWEELPEDIRNDLDAIGTAHAANPGPPLKSGTAAGALPRWQTPAVRFHPVLFTSSPAALPPRCVHPGVPR